MSKSTSFPSLIANLNSLQTQLTWCEIIHLVLGNTGNILNCVVFLQKPLRKNSCSKYFLASSVVNIFILNFGILTNLYSINYRNPLSYSFIYCKLRTYILHSLLMLSRTYIVLACIDRFALCSPHAKRRQFSRPHVADLLIPLTAIIWFIIPIHIPIFIIFEQQKCVMLGLYYIFFSIYALIFAGTAPPILMITFSLLAYQNIRRIRNRIQPDVGVSRVRIKNRDHQLMSMLFVEVVVYILSTVLYPLNTIYSALTLYDSRKNAERLSIENFLTFLTGAFLLYINNSSTFYIYCITSKTFRQELKKVCINHCLKYILKSHFNQTQTTQFSDVGLTQRPLAFKLKYQKERDVSIYPILEV
ncbi:unnamed protein product [Didymodactylos carnosus]|uniref:G-protein coupled receptors family 1 profile domain-containing protein n=1 Tax=Didymodactylos carnosus TaxID=1234261 RepID=A0A815MSS9_9BILA|nr:unnamed protein product [Didymodactylos carnosus]CAF1422390.1 unnamed protein product [Didymodactylos carnosus]CAF4191169.1 unnamed protein product [Didymodactylos carnosus]CAF4304839.1 unnamed protein product [Didymodactylos carnosus]